jgi:ABC-2 type transport system permease protein
MMKRKDFIVATLLMPVLAIGVLLAINYFVDRDAEPRKIALAGVDAEGRVHAVQSEALPPLEGYEWVLQSSPTFESLKQAVNERDVEAALLLPTDLAGADSVRLMVRREGANWRSEVEEHVLQQARLARAERVGLNGAALEGLDAPLPLEQYLTRPEARTSKGDMKVAMVMVVVIVMSLLTAVTYMGIGISGEKQARVTEVVISAIHPQSWIDGKVAAYTVIGLTQATAWAISLLTVVTLALHTIPPAVSLAGMLITLVYAALGFAFYAAFFALIMATIKDLQSTTKFQAYLIVIPLVPLMIMDTVVQNPEALWAVLISQLPIFSPMLMPARWAVNGAAPWEIGTAIVILLVSLYYMRLAAGHAFRIGMLMYGKEITLPELWKWARSS